MKTLSLQVVCKVSELTRRLSRKQEECQRQMHVRFHGKSVGVEEKKREERKETREKKTNLMLI